MRPRTLIVLAALVAALGAFIAFVERDLPGSEERRERERRVFGALEADDLTALEIDWQGTSVRLERDAKPAASEDEPLPPAREWRVTAPFTARADRQLADRVAGALAALEIERRLEGAARAEVGLEPSRGRVTWSAGGRQGVLEIGGEVPASSNVVVATAGDADPLVVGGGFVDDLDTPPGDWRDKQVLASGRDDIERIRLVPAGGEEIVLVRRGESFEVERPYADAADPDLVDPLLGDLTALRAERFLDAPHAAAAASGLAAGPGRYELAVAGRSAPRVVEVGGAVEGEGESRYVAVDDQALVGRTRLAEPLGRAPEEWRSKRWSGFDSWRVERIRVEDAGGTLTLVRDAGDWKRDGAKIPYTDVGDLLYAITSARAERVLTGEAAAAVPSAEPQATIVLADADGGEQTLTLHGSVEGGVAARVSGRDVVLVLPEAAVGELRDKLAAVRAAAPLEPAAAEGAGDGGAEAPAGEVEGEDES